MVDPRSHTPRPPLGRDLPSSAAGDPAETASARILTGDGRLLWKKSTEMYVPYMRYFAVGVVRGVSICSPGLVSFCE